MVKDEWDNDVTPLMQALWLYREENSQDAKEKRLAVVDWLLRQGVDLGHIHEQAELPTSLSVVLDANDPELNRLFGVISSNEKYCGDDEIEDLFNEGDTVPKLSSDGRQKLTREMADIRKALAEVSLPAMARLKLSRRLAEILRELEHGK